MSDRDDAAAAFYETAEHRRTTGKGRKRESQPRRLSSHVPIRFDAATIEAVKRFSDEDGLTVSAWIRTVVDREVQWRLARKTFTTHDRAPGLSFEMIEGPPPPATTTTASSATSALTA